MLTIPTFANAPTTLSLPPSVLAVTTSDNVSTRLTSVALPAPLSDQPVADNPQNNASAGSSSSFIAQLLSQGESDNQATSVAATYARFAPAPEYNTFVGYGFIKYKPSGAGVPPQRSPLPSPVTTYTESSATVPVETPPPAPVSSQDAIIAEGSGNTPPATTEVPPAPVNAAQNTVVQSGASLSASPAPITPASDLQAYTQTASRNQSNLSSLQPQLSIDG